MNSSSSGERYLSLSLFLLLSREQLLWIVWYSPEMACGVVNRFEINFIPKGIRKVSSTTKGQRKLPKRAKLELFEDVYDIAN